MLKKPKCSPWPLKVGFLGVQTYLNHLLFPSHTFFPKDHRSSLDDNDHFYTTVFQMHVFPLDFRSEIETDRSSCQLPQTGPILPCSVGTKAVWESGRQWRWFYLLFSFHRGGTWDQEGFRVMSAWHFQRNSNYICLKHCKISIFKISAFPSRSSSPLPSFSYDSKWHQVSPNGLSWKLRILLDSSLSLLIHLPVPWGLLEK